MKDSLVRVVFCTIAIVTAASAQEMFPAFLGAKVPFLAIGAVYAALRGRNGKGGRREEDGFGWIVVAVASGMFEDALDGASGICAAAFVPAAAAAARFARPFLEGLPAAAVGAVAAGAVAPIRELWLAACCPAGCFAVPLAVRFPASVLPAAIAGAALFAVLPVLERHAGFDGYDPKGGGR